jgi:hypothetical protein
MAQHVGMHGKANTGRLTCRGNDLAHSSRCYWPPALSHEDITGLGDSLALAGAGRGSQALSVGGCWAFRSCSGLHATALLQVGLILA